MSKWPSREQWLEEMHRMAREDPEGFKRQHLQELPRPQACICSIRAINLGLGINPNCPVHARMRDEGRLL